MSGENTKRGRGRKRYNTNKNINYNYSPFSSKFKSHIYQNNTFPNNDNCSHKTYHGCCHNHHSHHKYQPDHNPNNFKKSESTSSRKKYQSQKGHTHHHKSFSFQKLTYSNNSKYFKFTFPFKNFTFEQFLIQFHVYYETHSRREFGDRIYNLRYNLKGIYKAEYFRILSTYSVHEYYKVLKHLLAFDSSIAGNTLSHIENVLSHCQCDICASYYDRVQDMHFAYLSARECRTKQTPYKIETMKCFCVRLSLLI